MNNKIQIKRSNGNSAPTGLLAGELAWSDNNASAGGGGANGYLYIGDAGTSIAQHKIGGPGWGLELLDSSALTGIPTAPTASTGTSTTQLATTAFVTTAVSNASPAMNDISDATIASEADADLIIWNATNSAWENKSMTGHVSLGSDGSTIVTNVQDGAVTLGTQTVGSYVKTLVGGDNIDVSGEGGEDASVTVALSSNVTIAGNLTVSGTTTQVDSTTVSIADPIFVIGESGSSDDGKDRGIEFNYFDGSAKIGYFGWDNSADAFTFIADASNTSEVFGGLAGDVAFGNIAGTLTTASQTAITGVGTITAGTWNATKIGEAYGGTNLDTSSGSANDAGVATVTGGTWSIESNLDVAYGGTGLSTLESNAVMVGNGAGSVTMISTSGNNGKLLRVESGVPTWSDTLDAGTW